VIVYTAFIFESARSAQGWVRWTQEGAQKQTRRLKYSCIDVVLNLRRDESKAGQDRKDADLYGDDASERLAEYRDSRSLQPPKWIEVEKKKPCLIQGVCMRGGGLREPGSVSGAGTSDRR